MNTFEQIHIQRWRLRSIRRPSTSVDLIENTEHLTTDKIASIVPAANLDITETNSDGGTPIATDTAAEQSSLALASQSVVAVPDPVMDLDWRSMQTLIESDKHCPSCRSENSMLGSGAMQAEWMFVTDAPSSSDVQQDQIFTGRAGQLYEAVLAALGLQRSEVYTSSVFKCAPPEDLSVSPSCDKLLRRQIELVCPKVIVAFGEFAAQAVIKANESLEVLREKEQRCITTEALIVPTYSPMQMLDDNALKALVWSDLKKCLNLLSVKSEIT